MIYGKKDQDRKEWHKVYIIFPRRLVDGRRAMLCYVERCDYLAHHIPIKAPNSIWGWCYREIVDE